MKAAIIGCGSIADVHAAALKKERGVELRAFADCIVSRAETCCGNYGDGQANAYEFYKEMIEKEKPDVVHICTPHSMHVPMALYSLEHGCHVFMEKPPGISRKEFASLLAEEGKGGKIGICLQNRYNPTTKKVKELLADKVMGDVLGARAFVTWCRKEDYYTKSGWRGSHVTEGGGALINQAVHTLDLLVYFLGKPQWTEGSVANHHLKGVIEVEDTVEAYIQFSGAAACFYATTAYAADSNVMLEICCRNGTIRLEGNTVSCVYAGGRRECFEFCSDGAAGKSYWGNGHEACIHDFYEALSEHREITTAPATASATFALMMDIYESAKKADRIPFSEMEAMEAMEEEL